MTLACLGFAVVRHVRTRKHDSNAIAVAQCQTSGAGSIRLGRDLKSGKEVDNSTREG